MTFKEVYRNEAGTLLIDKDESIRVLLRTEILGIKRTMAIPSEAIPALIEALQDSDRELGEYIRINHPSIMEEYNRYQDRHNPPKVGEEIITLRGGFGGPAEVALTEFMSRVFDLSKESNCIGHGLSIIRVEPGD